jgi:hypothetical protein
VRLCAKWQKAPYWQGERGWVKIKNPAYWRRDFEREAMQKAGERRRARAVFR